jgi:hypothetical protein
MNLLQVNRPTGEPLLINLEHVRSIMDTEDEETGAMITWENGDTVYLQQDYQELQALVPEKLR